MNLATAFVIDTFNGQKFMKQLLAWDSVIVGELSVVIAIHQIVCRFKLTNTFSSLDWISLCIYTLIPVITASLALYAGTDYWWEVTTLTWFISVFVYFALFSMVSVYFEVEGCYELLKFSDALEAVRKKAGAHPTNFNLIKQGILLSLRQKLSGTVTFSYMSHSDDPRISETTFEEIKNKKEGKRFIGLYSRLTWILSKCGLFKDLGEHAKRYYSIDDVRDYAPYITSESWGLERLYFRNRKARYVAVISGDSALTKDQILSSFACDIIGTFLVAFTLVALVVWMEPPIGAVIFVAVLFFLWVFRRLRGSHGRMQVYQNIMGRSKNDPKNEETGTLYQVEETFRVYEARDMMCWLCFIAIVVLFIIVPLFILFSSRNYPLGFLFIPTSIITAARYFFNSAACAQEIGSLDGIEKNNKHLGTEHGPEEEWREKHRLSNIIGQISSGPRNAFWIYTFIAFVAIFSMITAAGIATGTNDGYSSNILMAPGDKFYYPGSADLEYATCTLGKGVF